MPRFKKSFRSKIITKRQANLVGLKELTTALADLGEAVESDKIYDVLMKGAKTARDEIKDLAPYDPKRKKGVHLRDAVFADEGDPSKDPRGPTVLVGVNSRLAPHAVLVERGTSKMAANPYYRQGIAAARPAVAAIVADGVRDIIKDIAG